MLPFYGIYWGTGIDHRLVRVESPHFGHCFVRARLRKWSLQIGIDPHEVQYIKLIWVEAQLMQVCFRDCNCWIAIWLLPIFLFSFRYFSCIFSDFWIMTKNATFSFLYTVDHVIISLTPVNSRIKVSLTGSKYKP